MGKTTKRVISLVLTVLMVLSCISAFALPAMAETAPVSATYDFDTLIKGNTYLINGSWTSRDLQTGKQLEFVFNGKTHKVTYDAKKHFASYADAFNSIWSGLTAANYFTYNPTIIFAPGTYNEAMQFVASCTILGNNAGISPNATITDENWNTKYIGENGGWPANTSRHTETIISNSFSVHTRPADQSMPASGDGAKWAVMKELAFNANPTAATRTVVDGITANNNSVIFSQSGYDVGKSAEWNGSKVTVAGGRQIVSRIQNSIVTTTKFMSAWNTNRDYFHFEADNIRSTGALTLMFERYVDSGTITNSFITGYTNRLLDGGNSNNFTNCAVHTDISLTFEKSVLYNGPSGNVWAFYHNPNTNGFKFKMKDNLLYNVSGGNYGVFRIDSTKGMEQFYTIVGNEIYHDYSSTQTYFNGNSDYITNGPVHIDFNYNRLISPTIKSFVPNSQYDDAGCATLLYYNFDHNFWSTERDGAGKKVTFLYGPNTNGKLASGWDYQNPNYFYDYNMTYASNGTKLDEVKFGVGNTVEIKQNVLFAKCFDTEQPITPEFIIDEAKLGSAKPKIEMATDIAFTNIIETLDLKGLEGIATYYVRCYYENTNYETVYKLNVLAANPVDFNDNFMANGMEFAGYDLEYKNTAVLVSETVQEGDAQYGYGFIGDTYYRFKVDNDLVFKTLEGIKGAMFGVDKPHVILPSGEYGDLTFDLAATYIGSNANVDPVDDTISVLDDGSDWAIGEGWGDFGETAVGSIHIADGTVGNMVFNGITMRGNFNDTYRTMGKEGVAYGDLNITVKNMVIDQDGTAKIIDTRTTYVKGVPSSAGGSSTSYSFNLINARNVNYKNTQLEYDKNGAATEYEYPGFGDNIKESFTLDSVWVKNNTATPRFMNEFVAPHTTIKNLYRDSRASGADTIITWAKVGTATKNASFKFINNNIRNGVTENKEHPIIGIEGSTRNNSAGRLPAGNKFDVVVSDNVFYNAQAERENYKMTSLEIAYFSSLKLNNNFIYADEDLTKTAGLIGYATSYASNAAADDLEVLNALEIKGNTFVGVKASSLDCDLGMGKNNPVFEDTFATEVTEDYLTAKNIGIKVVGMGNNPYYLDYSKTLKSDKVMPQSVAPKTDKVTGAYLDNSTMEIGATISEGKLSDIGIVLPEGVTGTWYTDEECLQPFEDKTVAEIGYNAVYYYVTSIVVDDITYSYKYKAEIYTVESVDFADVQDFDPQYFSNNAVIITDKAAGLAAGSIVVEEWDGVKYRFYAGVNAFDTYASACAVSTPVVEILVKEATVANGVKNGSDDLVVSRSMKLFTPNYNVNPVITDGFATNSPSNGKAWTYNTKFDANKDAVRIKNVSTWTGGGKETVELYGLTVDSGIYDNGREHGATIDYKVYNTLFSMSRQGSNAYVFTFGSASSDYGRADQKNTFLLKNAYFAKAPTTNGARLMGELIPAHITFDTIYLDFYASNFNYPGYVKNTAADSAITFKNSYLANSVIRCTKDADSVANATFTESVNNIWNGYSYDEDGNGTLDTQMSTIKPGYNNKIVFDNNIMDNYAGFFRPSNGSAALLHIVGASFNEISVTNNYIAAPKYIPASNGKTYEVKSFDMYWSAGNKWGEAIKTAEGVFRVTGNVMTFVTGNGNVTYGESGNRAINFTHYVYDNFRVASRVNDTSDYGLDAQPMCYDSNKPIGQGTNYDKVVGPTYYRLTADGKYLSNKVNPYTFADRVSINDGKATINSTAGDLFTAVEGGYEFDLSSLIKNNLFKNKMTVTYGDTTVDMATGKLTVTADAFAATGYDFTVKVDSIDGTAAEDVYTFTVTNTGTASAFAGEGGVIKSNAIMITAKANGTDTVVENWKGVPYTFVSGTTAFKTVEEALTYAAANSLTDVQLLLVNSNNRTDINITYPCRIYAENWNVEPHTKDGNGPDSPTHGYGWDHNLDYLANQTHVYRTYLKEGFPTNGIFEIYGVTMHGVYRDQRTTKANVAKVKVENIMLDLEEVNSRYMFVLNNDPNRYTAGNSFEFKNLDFYRVKDSLTLSWLWGNEFGPQTVIVDNMFIDDAAGVQMLDGTSYMKSETKNALVEIKNSYIGSSVDNVTSHNVQWEGNKNAIKYDSGTDTLSKNAVDEKLALRYTNNIFHNYISRRSATENSFIYILSYGLREVSFVNNYFDIAEGLKHNSMDALTYNGGALAKTANADPAMTVKYVVTNNVFNGYSGAVINFTPSGRYHSNSKLTIQNNYRLQDYVYGLYTGNDPMGLPLNAYAKNTVEGAVYYSLNYARDAYDTTVGVPEYNMLDNLVVNANSSVFYAPDTKLYVDAGNIYGTVDHIVKSYPAYNTIKLVVDGVEKDIDATIEGATSVAIRLYATDGTTYKDFAVVINATTAHEFGNWTVVVPATCVSDAVEKGFCTGACGDDDCTAYTTRVAVGSSAEADHAWPARGITNEGTGTCQTNGTWTFTCTVDGCGATKTEEQPDSKVPHEFLNDAYVAHEPATCAKAGTEIAKCTWCDETNVRTNAVKYPVDKDGHNFGEWIYNEDASCTKDGTETHTCGCGYSESRISPTYTAESYGHTWGEYVYNGDVSCVNDGTMTARCTVDGCRARNTIADPNFPASDKFHVYGEYKSNGDATCCEDGTKTATCTVDGCGATNTIADKGTATGHKDVSGQYNDVATGKWYNEAINYNVEHKFISGMSAAEFGVSVNVTRGMFVTVLARIAGVDTTKNDVTTKFTDVAKGKYFTAAIKWASENGVVNGMSETTFAPNANITRQQLAVMIVNFAKAENIELTAKNAAVAFADVANIANWAKEAVAVCQRAGIISGYTENGKTFFNPAKTATRAEAAQMIFKFHSEFIAK